MGWLQAKHRLFSSKGGQATRDVKADDEGILFTKDGGFKLADDGVDTISVSTGTGATPVTVFEYVHAEVKNASAEIIYFNKVAVTGATDGYPILPGEAISIKREPNLYFWSAAAVDLHYAILE